MKLTMGDNTTLEIRPGDELSRVRYRSDTHGRNSLVLTDDVVGWLRAMLREIEGPSIEDVREVWGNPFIWIRWWVNPQPDMSGVSRSVCEVVDRLGRGIMDGRQRFATEREALQAAYDAGVARRGGDDA